MMQERVSERDLNTSGFGWRLRGSNSISVAKESKMADKPQHGPPHGMEKYDLGGNNDLGALSVAQQADLNQFKVDITFFSPHEIQVHNIGLF